MLLLYNHVESVLGPMNRILTWLEMLKIWLHQCSFPPPGKKARKFLCKCAYAAEDPLEPRFAQNRFITTMGVKTRILYPGWEM